MSRSYLKGPRQVEQVSLDRAALQGELGPVIRRTFCPSGYRLSTRTHAKRFAAGALADHSNLSETAGSFPFDFLFLLESAAFWQQTWCTAEAATFASWRRHGANRNVVPLIFWCRREHIR